jgi:hypothetical protein
MLVVLEQVLVMVDLAVAVVLVVLVLLEQVQMAVMVALVHLVIHRGGQRPIQVSYLAELIIMLAVGVVELIAVVQVSMAQVV